MKFNIQELNPGCWFNFTDNPDEGSICLRVCDGDTLKAIFKATSKSRVTYKDRQRYEYEDVDPDLRSVMIWDYCIVDWKGLMDSDDNPIPCTKENKILLMGKSVTFATFVSEKINELNDLNKVHEEELAKN